MRWLSTAAVQAIHGEQLAEHGGAAGSRDHSLLGSALARLRNLKAYADPCPDMAALAAAYAFGIIRSHPFVDGNKRVGFVAAATFLLLNGHDLEVAEQEVVRTVLAVTAGTLDEPTLADWFRRIVRAA